MVLVLYLIGSEGGARYHGPITDRRKAKPKPFPGTFDSCFKTALYSPKITFGLVYEMTNLPFVFSKYIQFVNILIFFVQSKFTRQGKRN